MLENDPRLAAERVAYDSPKGKISGYLVRPAAKANARLSLLSRRTAGSIRTSRILPDGLRTKAS